jgi:hypothetical protein
VNQMQVPRGKASDAWQDPELIFTSAYGAPYEPQNFNRQFAVRRKKAGVLYIRVHDTRRVPPSQPPSTRPDHPDMHSA